MAERQTERDTERKRDREIPNEVAFAERQKNGDTKIWRGAERDT